MQCLKIGILYQNPLSENINFEFQTQNSSEKSITIQFGRCVNSVLNHLYFENLKFIVTQSALRKFLIESARLLRQYSQTNHVFKSKPIRINILQNRFQFNF